MPYSRPTLTQLRNQAAQDLAAALPGTDALLRFANLKLFEALAEVDFRLRILQLPRIGLVLVLP